MEFLMLAEQLYLARAMSLNGGLPPIPFDDLPLAERIAWEAAAHHGHDCIDHGGDPHFRPDPGQWHGHRFGR